MTQKIIQKYIKSPILWLGLIIAVLCLPKVYAGEKLQVNFLLAPSYERIGFANAKLKSPFSFKYSYNFGGDLKYYFSPKIAVNVGLQFNDKGFRSYPSFITSDGTIQQFDDAVINVSNKYLSLPLDFSFNFQPFFRTEAFISSGLSFGYLLSQTFKGKRVSKELGRPDDPIFEGVSSGRSNIIWFDKSLVTWNVGVGFSWLIRSRVVCTINPSFSYQIDKSLNPQGPINPIGYDKNGDAFLIKPKFQSFLIICKLGYYFNDQIENTKKKL